MKRNITILTLTLAATLSASLAIDLDTLSFGEDLGGWDPKYNTAAYTIAATTYKTYRPTVTPTVDDGIFVTTKIQHSRGRRYGTCHLEMTFDHSGNVVAAQAKIKIGNRTYDSKIVELDRNAYEDAEVSGKNIASPTSQIATELFARLDEEILKWQQENTAASMERRDLIGRLSGNKADGESNLSGAIQHNFNLIAANVGGSYGRRSYNNK